MRRRKSALIGPDRCQGGAVCLTCRRTVHGHLLEVLQRAANALIPDSCLYCGRVSEAQQRTVDWTQARCYLEVPA